jgi:uncharacterized membrane protein
MSPLVKELLINGLMAGTAVRSAKKTSASFGYIAAAGVVGGLALVFFSIAGYGFLLQTFSMPIAAGLTGCAILMLSVLIAAVGNYRIHRKAVRKPHIATDGSFVDNIENTIKSLIGGVEGPVKDNPTMALLLAALAGFAAGDQLGGNDKKYH